MKRQSVVYIVLAIALVALFLPFCFVRTGEGGELIGQINNFFARVGEYAFEAKIIENEGDTAAETIVSDGGGGIVLSSGAEKYFVMLQRFFIPSSAEKRVSAGGLVTEYRTGGTVFFVTRRGIKRIEGQLDGNSFIFVFYPYNESPHSGQDGKPDNNSAPNPDTNPAEPPELSVEEEAVARLKKLASELNLGADIEISSDAFKVRLLTWGSDYFYADLLSGYEELFIKGVRVTRGYNGQDYAKKETAFFYQKAFLALLSDTVDGGGFALVSQADPDTVCLEGANNGLRIEIVLNSGSQAVQITIYEGVLRTLEIVVFGAGESVQSQLVSYQIFSH